MQKITVSRNDDIYEAFADIARAADGTLVCTYRESMCHSQRPFSRVVVRRSGDRGLTWGPRQVICECTREETAAGKGRYNCSRIAACADGTLLLAVDELHVQAWEEYLEPAPCRNLLFRSGDAGLTWEGPEDTGITAGIVPSIKELANGDLLIGVTEQFEGDDPGRGFSEAQDGLPFRRRRRHLGRTGEGAQPPGAHPPAARSGASTRGTSPRWTTAASSSTCARDGERLSAWKSLSEDGGRTWSEPLRSQIPCCHGRPSVGRLRSGEVAVTYRMSIGRSTSLALYVESAAEAVRGLAGAGARDMEDYTSTAEARLAVLDNDRSAWADSGYSGWVQLDSGDLYVVNYVNGRRPPRLRPRLPGRQGGLVPVSRGPHTGRVALRLGGGVRRRDAGPGPGTAGMGGCPGLVAEGADAEVGRGAT